MAFTAMILFTSKDLKIQFLIVKLIKEFSVKLQMKSMKIRGNFPQLELPTFLPFLFVDLILSALDSISKLKAFSPSFEAFFLFLKPKKKMMKVIYL
jgi:hypothetical protein